MRNRTRFTLSLAVIGLTALALSILFAPTAAVAKKEKKEPILRLDAIAANMGAVGPRGQVRLDITVDRWSTDEEREVLVTALKEDARKKLPKELQKQDRVGRIREIQGLGYDLKYSREFPGEGGGRQIVLATDRPMGFAEVSRSARTTRYNVTLVVVTLDAEGNGEGQLIAGAEFTWDEENEQLTIENFSSEPVRLPRVTVR